MMLKLGLVSIATAAARPTEVLVDGKVQTPLPQNPDSPYLLLGEGPAKVVEPF